MSNLGKKVKIVVENEHFLGLHKPSGLLVHPRDRKEAQKPLENREYTLVDYLKSEHPEVTEVDDRPNLRPGIVHRLDKPTSGIMIVAKTQKFFDHFKRLLKNREVKKSYLALVWGYLEESGQINESLGLKPGTTRWTTWGSNRKMVKDALTEYEPVETFRYEKDEFTLVKLFPKTGRTHQLRAHMLSIHHPIVGDFRYGKEEDPFNLDRPFLHAYSLEFNNLKDKRVKIGTNLSKDLVKVLNTLNSKEVSKFS